MTAQIKGDYPVRQAKVAQLITPLRGLTAKAVDQDQRLLRHVWGNVDGRELHSWLGCHRYFAAVEFEIDFHRK
jgi:hypothetical protein